MMLALGHVRTHHTFQRRVVQFGSCNEKREEDTMRRRVRDVRYVARLVARLEYVYHEAPDRTCLQRVSRRRRKALFLHLVHRVTI